MFSAEYCQHFDKKIVFLTQSICTCLIMILVSFPVGLQAALLSSPFNFSNVQYGCFFGFFNLPNLIFPIIVGAILDRHGLNKFITYFFDILVLIGCILMIIGSELCSCSYLILGRVFVGIGVESIHILINRFFMILINKENSAMYWGIRLISVRIGEALGNNLSISIYSETKDVPTCFYVNLVIGLSLSCFFHISLYLSENSDFQEEFEAIREKTDETLSGNKLKAFFKEVNIIFWLFVLLNIFTYLNISAIISELTQIIVKTFNISTINAGYYTLFYSLTAIITSLSAGVFFKFVGNPMYFLFIGLSIMLLSCAFFIFLVGTIYYNTVLIPLLFLGISSTLEKQFLLLTFSFIVDIKYSGISYGFHRSSLNFGVFLGPILFGYILDLSATDLNRNLWPFSVIIIFIIVKLILMIIIVIYDKKSNYKLVWKK